MPKLPKPIMTLKEFDAIMPKLKRLSLDNIEIAKSVMVFGESQTAVAKRKGLTRQRVNNMVMRVRTLAGKPEKWKRVDVRLPPDLAKQVRDLEKN